MVSTFLAITSGLLAFAILVASPVSAGPTSPLHQYRCESFSASLRATAVNVDNVTLNSTYSGNITVGPAVFRLAFHFCEPSHTTRHSRVLQVLGHGEYPEFAYVPSLTHA